MLRALVRPQPLQLQLARLASKGLTRKEIAGRLFISENSVKTHLGHVYAKLGVRNRLEMEHKLPARVARAS